MKIPDICITIYIGNDIPSSHRKASQQQENKNELEALSSEAGQTKLFIVMYLNKKKKSTCTENANLWWGRFA